jgi:hypothetical protein
LATPSAEAATGDAEVFGSIHPFVGLCEFAAWRQRHDGFSTLSAAAIFDDRQGVGGA